jgi:hypothetical protein
MVKTRLTRPATKRRMPLDFAIRLRETRRHDAHVQHLPDHYDLPLAYLLAGASFSPMVMKATIRPARMRARAAGETKCRDL